MHFADEIVGITSAGIAAFMASKAKQSAEKGSPSVPGAIRDAVSQRLPKMFGFGRVDEQLFESLRQLLDPGTRRLVDFVIGAMHDYEADIFRLTTTGMPCGNELADKSVTDSKGKITTTKEVRSWEMTGKDLRVKYLTDIADEVAGLIAKGQDERAAATTVVEGMRSRRLITRSPAAQKAYELWVDATEWTKKNVLDFFEVQSFDEITDTIMAQKINETAGKIPPQPGDLSLNPFRGIGATFKKLFF